MNDKAISDKGATLEEALRAFFLRAGFFVIRGVPFRFAGEDLTDVDLWLYERPTGTARRIQICDIKYKQRPKAVERIFWTYGLAKALEVDGAYVATTDKRKNLKAIADKLNVQLIDGTDVQRILVSPSTLYPERIGDEQLIRELQSVDNECRNRTLQDARIDILSSLSDGFGAPSAVRALEGFSRLAKSVISFHPGSKAAQAAGRLAYLAAAIACESLDYISIKAAFQPFDDRRELILNAVRFGALSDDNGQQTLHLALGLVAKYAPGGKATARAVENGLKQDFERIPAEIVADQAVRLLKGDQLFMTGREFEMACYQTIPPSFDQLSVPTKSMLGALLDYAEADRERFAHAWSSLREEVPPIVEPPPNDPKGGQQANLFSEGK